MMPKSPRGGTIDGACAYYLDVSNAIRVLVCGVPPFASVNCVYVLFLTTVVSHLCFSLSPDRSCLVLENQ